MEVDEPRPSIRVLMALPREGPRPRPPLATTIVDLFEVQEHQRNGWVAIGVDPETEQAFYAWRAAHEDDGA